MVGLSGGLVSRGLFPAVEGRRVGSGIRWRISEWSVMTIAVEGGSKVEASRRSIPGAGV